MKLVTLDLPKYRSKILNSKKNKFLTLMMLLKTVYTTDFFVATVHTLDTLPSETWLKSKEIETLRK